jgi:Glu-tRNA(Gln) amidotransferase subunit E-like FAD-binding protein
MASKSQSESAEEAKSRLHSAAEKTEQHLLDSVKIDLDLAETFLKRAAITRREENRRQSIVDARTAYQTLLHALPTLKCTEAERKDITRRLTILREHLISWGETV